MCTKNYDQTMYGSQDMVHNRQTDAQTEKVTFRGALPKNKVCMAITLWELQSDLSWKDAANST